MTMSLDNVHPMGKEITEQDILLGVKLQPNNKTPGEDGLPYDFIKFYGLVLKYYY